MSVQSLDQERAKYAWQCVATGVDKEYTNIAKGAPALIMGNGLMQALAFLHNKSDAAKKLANHVSKWVASRLRIEDGSFKSLMDALVKKDSDFYLRATEEALEVLRWIRQFAAAVGEGGTKA
jgi:CRISPR-associated protein Cmr5